MKIKKYIVSFVVLMLSFSLFAGCSNLSDKLGEPGRSSESKTKTVESTDGKFTLEVPTKWTDKTSLNEEAVLSVMNGAQ